jgi:hypothetical protein
MSHGMHPVPGGFVPGEGPSRRSRWQTAYPWILGVLAVATIVLGTIGYHRYLEPTVKSAEDAGAAHSDLSTLARELHLWANCFYFSVQLFALHSGFYHEFLDHPPGTALQIARWTAVLASFGTIGYALTAFLLQWVRHLRIHRWKNHVIVCGLGYWTVELIQKLASKGERVIVIEKDPSDELIPTCVQLGVPVMFGDASSGAILENAGIREAGCLIAFTSDDGTNIETTLTARRLLQSTGRDANPLICHTHVVDRILMQALERQLTVGPPGGSIEVQLFNSYENAARRAIHDAITRVQPEQIDAVETVHLILLGLSTMGESVVLQAVRNCHFKAGRGFRLTVIEPVSQTLDAFVARYPALPELCDFRVVIGTGTGARERELIELAAKDPKQLLFLAVCFDGDQHSLDTVLRLPRDIEVKRIPVYVWLSNPAGLAKVIESELAAEAGLPGEIRAFGLPDQCAGPDAIMRPEIDAVARAIHDEYRIERLNQMLNARKIRVPATPEGAAVDPDELERLIEKYFDQLSEPAMLPWTRLPEGLRNSNRLQADHIPFKLLSVGWYAAVEPVSPADQPVDFSQPTPQHLGEVNTLSEIEHRRWIAERRLAGWIFGPKEAGLRQSPYLVPWGELADEVRNYDRQVIEALPLHLALRGLRLYRRA